MKRVLASTLATTLSAAALAALAVIAVPASAQPAPSASPDARIQPRAERPFSLPSERIEARLAYVRTALKITDAQESQWKTYADKLRQVAAEHDKAFQDWRARAGAPGAPGGRPTLIERMENRQKFHADSIRTINELLAVQKPLYASLSAEQKRVAEVVLAPRGRDGMRGGGSGHERGHGHGNRQGPRPTA